METATCTFELRRILLSFDRYHRLTSPDSYIQLASTPFSRQLSYSLDRDAATTEAPKMERTLTADLGACLLVSVNAAVHITNANLKSRLFLSPRRSIYILCLQRRSLPSPRRPSHTNFTAPRRLLSSLTVAPRRCGRACPPRACTKYKQCATINPMLLFSEAVDVEWRADADAVGGATEFRHIGEFVALLLWTC